MNGDLISREALKKALDWIIDNPYVDLDREIMEEIDNAPTIEAVPLEHHNKIKGFLENEVKSLVDILDNERPKGEYFDMSKLRLMKVEECAGHTIDYAMGWKACIEWIKKGGDNNDS